jgi:hypothetical protein
VVAPTLPGMGGTAEELAAVTLEAGRISRGTLPPAARRNRRAGGAGRHSRGGLVVSTAAERDPRAMDALVYICAMMLPAGLSRAEFKEVGPNARSRRSSARSMAASPR